MSEVPMTDIDPDDDFVLGAPPEMPDEVWESSLDAAFNSADVDESLYPDDVALTDGIEVEELQTVDPEDNDPVGFYGGQEPERQDNWTENDVGY